MLNRGTIQNSIGLVGDSIIPSLVVARVVVAIAVFTLDAVFLWLTAGPLCDVEETSLVALFVRPVYTAANLGVLSLQTAVANSGFMSGAFILDFLMLRRETWRSISLQQKGTAMCSLLGPMSLLGRTV